MDNKEDTVDIRERLYNRRPGLASELFIRGRLHKVQFKKLIIFVDGADLDKLINIDTQNEANGKSPIWANRGSPGAYARVSVPQTQQQVLWDMPTDKVMSWPVSVSTYDSEQFGRGWYFRLNGQPF